MGNAKYLTDFYTLFTKEVSKLKYLVAKNQVLDKFYKEHVGEIKPLNTKRIMLLWKKTGEIEMALIFHEIYKKTECRPESKLSLLSCYREEICTLKSAELLFNNWCLKDLINLNEQDPEFENEFDEIGMENQFNGYDSNFYNYQFFDIFLSGKGILRDVIVDYASEVNNDIVNNMMDESIKRLNE